MHRFVAALSALSAPCLTNRLAAQSAPADTTVSAQLHLQPATTLDSVLVTATAPARGLAATGFYARQHAGWGEFMTPQRIDSLGSLS
jgi:hypothetical protein